MNLLTGEFEDMISTHLLRAQANCLYERELFYPVSYLNFRNMQDIKMILITRFGFFFAFHILSKATDPSPTVALTAERGCISAFSAQVTALVQILSPGMGLENSNKRQEISMNEVMP